MAVWRTQINYLRAALEGDQVQVATWPVRNDGKLRIERRFQIRRASDGETLLRALLHYVCIDLQTGRAKRMPGDFLRYSVAPDVAAAVAAEITPYQPGVEPG
jgi:acyl-CoA thioester hydrolase